MIYHDSQYAAATLYELKKAIHELEEWSVYNKDFNLDAIIDLKKQIEEFSKTFDAKINEMAVEELDNHDCHASPEDGCICPIIEKDFDEARDDQLNPWN